MAKGLLVLLMGLVLLGAAPTDVAAQENYGAVGLDPSSGQVAFITSQPSADAALTALKALCQENNVDCRDTNSFHDQCAALARSSDDHTYGLSIHDTRVMAQERAVATCQSNGGSGCNVHDTYCAPADLDE